jgi:hypothetical protein|tara:strand:+ start:405 stop:1316 length:912 start_codon:yes stop_codon:yes gene_type:complete
MAEKNKGILEMLNRGVMSAASLPYNLASDFTNAIPFINTPYIDADADGFMQGGFVDKKDFDAVEGFGVEKLNKRIADKKAKDAGIASLKKEFTDMNQPNAMGGKTTSKKATEKKKETTKKKEETDDRGMLQKLFERYDLVSLGNSIGRGEGLLPGIEKQEAAIKQEAKDSAAAQRQTILDASKINYQSALAEQASAYASKAGLPAEKIQIAQTTAKAMTMGTGLSVDSLEFQEAYTRNLAEILQKQLETSADPLGLGDAIKLGVLKGGGDPAAFLDQYMDQLPAGSALNTTGGQDNVRTVDSL